jgi:ABC-type proline/glycine betaine transport system ATPase subunit
MPTPAPIATALSAVDVSKRFGEVVALDRISLEIRERACVALVGESGSGKSTLLRCFNQRVALARALADEPAVLLLDEPFGALDAITRAEVQETFAAVRARLGTTSVLVTHDLHEAMMLATHIAVMHAGRLEQVATPAALVAEPATAYVRTLLARARVVSSESVS